MWRPNSTKDWKEKKPDRSGSLSIVLRVLSVHSISRVHFVEKRRRQEIISILLCAKGGVVRGGACGLSGSQFFTEPMESRIKDINSPICWWMIVFTNTVRKCLGRISPQEENKTDLYLFSYHSWEYEGCLSFQSALKISVFLTMFGWDMSWLCSWQASCLYKNNQLWFTHMDMSNLSCSCG